MERPPKKQTHEPRQAGTTARRFCALAIQKMWRADWNLWRSHRFVLRGQIKARAANHKPAPQRYSQRPNLAACPQGLPSSVNKFHTVAREMRKRRPLFEMRTPE